MSSIIFLGCIVGLLLHRQQQREHAQREHAQREHAQREHAAAAAAPAGATKLAILTNKVKQLSVANKRLGSHHQRLNSHRPHLYVPALPLTNAYNVAACPSRQRKKEHYDALVQFSQTRESNFEDKKSSHQDWLDLPTSFPYTDAASSETKEDINSTIASELNNIKAVQRLTRNPFSLLCLLDAPTFGTTNTLLSFCTGLTQHQSQIVIPQADVDHYFQMIGTQQKGHMLNIRCQRLDHWLCTNSGAGFRHILMYADYECTFVGNGNMRLSPLLDIQRWFRLKYPDCSEEDPALLVLTVKLRGSHFSSSLECIEDFIQVEGELNGYKVERIYKFAKSLTTLFYRVARLQKSSHITTDCAS